MQCTHGPLHLLFPCVGGLLLPPPPSLSHLPSLSPSLSRTPLLALTETLLSPAGREHITKWGPCSPTAFASTSCTVSAMGYLLGSLGRPRTSSQLVKIEATLERPLWSLFLEQELSEFQSSQASWAQSPRSSSESPLGRVALKFGTFLRLQSPRSVSFPQVCTRPGEQGW